MAFLSVPNVKIHGLSVCVPSTVEENNNLKLFQGEDAAKFMASTGVERRRIAGDNVTTSDLCYYAAEKLIADLGWNKEEIDCLIFVTQTPDYILPATSCILQHRLGLSEECYSMDISLGCSGWIYGLSTIGALIQNGNMKKGLLLTGDTVLKSCSVEDKSTWPLFGDAGTCTAIEYHEGDKGFQFHMATDGSGYEAIIIPEGGYRNPYSVNSLKEECIEEDIIRNSLNIALNGMDVFSFGINKAPETIHKLADKFDIDMGKIDYFVFHQANLFMNEKIRKKLKLPVEKVLYSLKDFGNTSSATIPLTMVTQCREALNHNRNRLIACGFGVGLSWGSVYFETDNLIISDLIEV
ncbi:3-oxoacyl-ACP synthase III family protein [Microbacter margulisiae]|uniref:3-oxoacyl-[acyl-carrier-protein] synthase-3 n=1 Tax=Microbacter margulisiae TaxID=1350067 RepID=A0A7W5GZY8_9PORP|nr:ketoacyl-ACP synthase III [Microbacter margulisiae]MBB3185973.1 3-oxoacyl-[acyl-carrier-protein] synthase-3 [Microbacter margulisiae]